jgi:predicted tellurium resistance membrane protein TerC
MDWITNPQIWLSLVTLTALEIVLGIDNVIFISILAGKLPPGQQLRARRTGLMLALVTRVLLLCSLVWLAKLTAPLWEIRGFALSGRDLILLGGGLFLIWKSTREIHEKLEGGAAAAAPAAAPTFGATIVQILLLDVVFSLDSVITAVGMANQLGVMIAAVVIALVVMLRFAGAISDYVHQHPTLKMLALSFLLLIGVTLVAEGTHQHVNKGYIYFAMAFSFGVELLNLRQRRRAEPVVLHEGQP